MNSGQQSAVNPRSSATRWDDGTVERVAEMQNEIEELEKTVDADWEQGINSGP